MTSAQTLAKVERACADLIHNGEEVSFTTVATLAGISRTSLYRDPTLRTTIEEHRTRSRDPRTMSGLASEVVHLRTAVEALAERVRRHEEKLRHLDTVRRPTRKAN